MKYRLQVLKAFIKKEIFQILRDPRMRFVLFVAPMIQLTIFGFALSTETRNIHIAMFAKPGDVMMRDLMNRALSTQWFVPAKIEGTHPMDWIESGSADVVLVAPPEGLGPASAEGRGKIQVLINAQNSLRAQSIEKYLLTISQNVFMSPEAQDNFHNYALIPGIKFDVRALYNPTFKTALYMVPGVMSMLVCLVTIILTSMAVAREKEVGTLETLTAAPIDTWDLIMGKTIPFIIMGALQLPLILLFAVIAFGLPVRGSFLMLTISSVLMIISTVSIGLFISSIAKNQQQAMFGGFIYLFPSYLLSGLMFPVENMPIYIQPFSYINPLTHYMGLLRNILLIGGDFHYFVIHTLALFFISILLLFFAGKKFKAMLV